jgi:hypothetical protein
VCKAYIILTKIDMDRVHSFSSLTQRAFPKYLLHYLEGVETRKKMTQSSSQRSSEPNGDVSGVTGTRMELPGMERPNNLECSDNASCIFVTLAKSEGVGLSIGGELERSVVHRCKGLFTKMTQIVAGGIARVHTFSSIISFIKII